MGTRLRALPFWVGVLYRLVYGRDLNPFIINYNSELVFVLMFDPMFLGVLGVLGVLIVCFSAFM